MGPKYFTLGHLLTQKWSVANVKSAVTPDRAEHDILEMILDIFVVRKPLCEVRIPS